MLEHAHVFKNIIISDIFGHPAPPLHRKHREKMSGENSLKTNFIKKSSLNVFDWGASPLSLKKRLNSWKILEFRGKYQILWLMSNFGSKALKKEFSTPKLRKNCEKKTPYCVNQWIANINLPHFDLKMSSLEAKIIPKLRATGNYCHGC